MVEVRVIGSKIRIKSDNLVQIAHLEQIIGTARQVPGDPFSLNCRCSIPNLRRIKSVAYDAKLSKDEETRSCIKMLQQSRARRAQENEHIRAAKAGRKWDLGGYQFKFQPYSHQEIGYHFMRACSNGAIFGDCGIGKTAIVASFLDYLVHVGEISEKEPALVVCPISIIVHAWIKDVEKFTDLNIVSLYEPSTYKRKEKRQARFDTPASVYITSFSQLRLTQKELRKKKFKFIAVDESTKIKNPQSQTYRALQNIKWKSKYRYVMSGTPAPNGPIDLWSQFFFLDEGLTLEPSIVDFRQQYYNQIDLGSRERGTYVATIWRPKGGMAVHINDMIDKRAVRFKSSDCLDLPKRTFMVREVEMAKEQKRAYDAMKDNLFVELDETTVTARVAVSKLMKLREITGGFVIDDEREERKLGSNPKAKELDALLEEVLASEEHKAIVWIQYRWEARCLLDRYIKKYGALGLWGGISQTVKDENIDKFLSNKSNRVLICHPKSAAHGLTFVVASYSIYYSLSHDFEEYYQSSMRIHRPGQTRPTFYYYLTAKDSIDQALLQCIRDKKNMQDVLVDGQVSPVDLLGGAK